MNPVVLQEKVEAQILASYQSLYRLAYSYVKNPDDAMDMVQEAVCKAIARSGDVRSEDAIHAWLCRIVVNSSLDFLHKKAREVTVETMPEETAEDRYQDGDTLRALDVLDQRERTVIVLRFFQDLRLQDIAQITGDNLSTVKTILYRSLKKLKVPLTEGESSSEG